MQKPQTTKMLVYLAVVARERATPRSIANDLPDKPRLYVKKAMQRLASEGYLLVENPRSTWGRAYVPNPNKRLRNGDERGRSKGSREALKIGWRLTAASLNNLRNVGGIIRPRPATAIEEAWGWGVNVPTILRVVATSDKG